MYYYLLTSINDPTGQSSSTHGYTTGGGYPTPTNVIQKFSFSSDADATDVGNALVAVEGQQGNQY